ncbi:phytase [Algoriphagus aestuarii]|nr:phytase [Algoriphagus aestuarii]
MFNKTNYWISGMALLSVFSCQKTEETTVEQVKETTLVKPLYVSDPVVHDTDDPAIWINPLDASKSLIIGTDKDSLGALYVFDLKGKTVDSLVRRDIQRPNNVDVGYQLEMGDSKIDFAVTGERLTSKLRFFKLPEMEEINPSGIEIYQGEEGPEFRDLMGVAIYKSPESGKTFVIAGRKNGPTDGSYLWQYEIKGSESGIELQLVRKFGNFSGNKEIEAIAVDHELGFVYYSDEGVGVRKYYADPEKGNEELALFASEGFTEDHEGISIYKTSEKTGYILVSDQGANFFHVFPREGTTTNPNEHPLLTKIPVSTISSDGSEVTNVNLGPDFPNGLFVAMSDDKTFQIYKWDDLAEVIQKSIQP